MRVGFFAQILVILLTSQVAFSFFRSDIEVFTDEERLKGFAEHNRRKQTFSEERESASGEMKAIRESWQKRLDSSVADYKAWKTRQKQALDESSEEYFEDQGYKKKAKLEFDQLRQEYVAERDKKRAQKKITIKLSEEKEYGLDEKPDRVEYRKRALYFPELLKKNKKTTAGGTLPSGSGSVDFGSPPAEFNPPVSQPPSPEFFEPEIPQPPPPPPPDFDDGIPPPIFDEAPDF